MGVGVCPQFQLPNVLWEDVQTLLYGANASGLFGPSLTWGGMMVSSDTLVGGRVSPPPLLPQHMHTARA